MLFDGGDGPCNRFQCSRFWGRGESGEHGIEVTMEEEEGGSMQALTAAGFIYSNYGFQNWEINCRMGLGTRWAHCDAYLS